LAVSWVADTWVSPASVITTIDDGFTDCILVMGAITCWTALFIVWFQKNLWLLCLHLYFLLNSWSKQASGFSKDE
jgi:hypothetical protein